MTQVTSALAEQMRSLMLRAVRAVMPCEVVDTGTLEIMREPDGTITIRYRAAVRAVEAKP